MTKQIEVGRVSNQRADENEVSKRTNRKPCDLSQIETTLFAQAKARQNEQSPTANHLLPGGEKQRGRAFRRSRIEGSNRPNQRRHQQDRHAQGEMIMRRNR